MHKRAYFLFKLGKESNLRFLDDNSDFLFKHETVFLGQHKIILNKEKHFQNFIRFFIVKSFHGIIPLSNLTFVSLVEKYIIFLVKVSLLHSKEI